MQTRIYLITHSDGCWLKAEYTVDHAVATRLARADYGDDVTVQPVPDTDAAAIKLARTKTAMGLGPWEACGNLIRTQREADGSGGFLIAEVPVNTGETSVKATAMAAAPEMYAALFAIVWELTEVPSSRDSYLPPPLVEKAEAAMAKAMGEQS